MPRIFALSPETGEQLWFAELPGTPRGQIADDGMLFTVDDGDATTAIDTVDGSVAWQFVDSESDARTSQPDAVALYGGDLPAVSETVVFTFTTGGDVIAIDRESGEEIWREGGFHSVASHLALAGDVLVVMSAEWWHGKNATPIATPHDADVAEEGFEAVVHHVYGLNPADGSVLWEQYIAGQVQQPAVSGSTIAFIGVPSGLDENSPVTTLLEDEVSKNITGIDASNGEILWTLHAGSNLYWQAYAVTDANGEELGFVASSIDGITFWSESGEEIPLLSGDNHFGVSSLASVDGVTVASLGDGTLVRIDTGQLSAVE
jgi:outer membrane protein assembly factor BamB